MSAKDVLALEAASAAKTQPNFPGLYLPEEASGPSDDPILESRQNFGPGDVKDARTGLLLFA